MVPKSGRGLPASHRLTDMAFAQAIGAALRSELGGSHRAAKTIMAWTLVSDRTARQWLNGRGSPSGRHLVQLAGSCRAVMATILELSAQAPIGLAIDLQAIESALEDMLATARKWRAAQS
jgi:hypothetical protein